MSIVPKGILEMELARDYFTEEQFYSLKEKANYLNVSKRF